MAIYSYTNSGITFNNIESAPNTKKEIPGKLVSNQNKFEYVGDDGIKPVVNAVEIDWNNAYLGNSYINTTGEKMPYKFRQEFASKNEFANGWRSKNN